MEQKYMVHGVPGNDYKLTTNDIGCLVCLDLSIFNIIENPLKTFLLLDIINEEFYLLDLSNGHKTKHYCSFYLKNENIYIDANFAWYSYEDLEDDIVIELFQNYVID